jgi:hypothetical protein
MGMLQPSAALALLATPLALVPTRVHTA